VTDGDREQFWYLYTHQSVLQKILRRAK